MHQSCLRMDSQCCGASWGCCYRAARIIVLNLSPRSPLTMAQLSASKEALARSEGRFDGCQTDLKLYIDKLDAERFERKTIQQQLDKANAEVCMESRCIMQTPYCYRVLVSVLFLTVLALPNPPVDICAARFALGKS